MRWIEAGLLASVGAIGCSGAGLATRDDAGAATFGPIDSEGSSTPGDSGEASGSTGVAGSTGTTGDAEPDTGGAATTIHYDLGPWPDLAGSCGRRGDGGPEFSYIWIANNGDGGTIARIDTQTMEHTARYYTRPELYGNPSRTSVNLDGDAVVANRRGGVTKFAVRTEDCVDRDGDGAITTSTDATPLPFADEECMIWHTPFVYDSQRPVAWTQGTLDDETCRHHDAKVWTAAHDEGTTTADIFLLDGDTGVVEATVSVDGLQTHVYGLYGAAVDAAGNLWASELGLGLLVHVDRVTLEVRTWPTPISAYGMTVDHQGGVWVCRTQAARFDPLAELWQTSDPLSTDGFGCMEDGTGTLWVAGERFVGVDIDTLLEVGTLDVPAPVRGVSFDLAGNVWGPSMVADEAYRVDPATGEVAIVGGLDIPYTYSDMTGFALTLTTRPGG